MKSKKSFFNKTIFKKNMLLYWPIWVLYTIVLVFAQPLMFWSNCYYSRHYETYTYYDKLEDFVEVIYLDIHVYIIAYVALASGMALYHYLYNHKSANMMHAFPVDRTQLFGTNVISGISFLAIPQTISCLLLAIVAACNGVAELHYVAYWWLLVLGTDIVAFSVVTFCAMFTGHLLALPAYAVIVNYFSYLVYYLIYVTITLFGFGITNLGNVTERLVCFLCPTECFVYNVGLCENFNPITRDCIGALVYGTEILAIYLVVAVVLYVAAFITYKKRHVEQAGEFITVGWVKPIFRFGIALAGGFFFGILMREFLRGMGIACNMAMFVVLLLFFGAISFFVADMLIHKSFRVFKKKNWKHCAICMVAMVVTFFSILGIGRQYEDYQPKLEEIETAYIDWGYNLTFEGEEIESVLAIHKEILDNKEICMTAAEKARYYDYEYVAICYQLKNGDYVRRSYELPNGYEEIEPILSQISDIEMDVDNYLSYVFSENYEDIEVFHEGWIEAQFKDGGRVDGEENVSYYYKTVNLSAEVSKKLFEAVLADTKDGNLMKYNVHNLWGRDNKEYAYSEVYLYMQFDNPKGEEDSVMLSEGASYAYPVGAYEEVYIDTETRQSAGLNIGPDCENIVNVLVECGIIKSVDDIWWGEISEDYLD